MQFELDCDEQGHFKRLKVSHPHANGFFKLRLAFFFFFVFAIIFFLEIFLGSRPIAGIDGSCSRVRKERRRKKKYEKRRRSLR
jgi:hypothetical protein